MGDTTQGGAKKIPVWEITLLLLGAVIGFGGWLIQENIMDAREEKKEVEKSALILYFDMKDAYDSISTQVKLSSPDSMEKFYLPNTVSKQLNNYSELIINLKSELTRDELKSIIDFYNSLELIEQSREQLTSIYYEQEQEENQFVYEDYQHSVFEFVNSCTADSSCMKVIKKLEELSVLEKQPDSKEQTNESDKN
ncbi:hypothetical protein [Niallia circulans]|uniref:hypothetical protein n=1 Tax=Niallia circulans TaxID=1397 RepID=UPI00077C2B5D|nr:hypothetical protein [Niallia circulans]MDR4318984.1 hypothetical protein [Niallia circulans]MED3839990.1 hypothetical protein [Niallia circulans]MED4245854.1 hypothetical protein [Niallia circulans]MED4250953.1 hypothetical protein [Niallia circulans]QKH60200.1 hypothetical protein FOC77_05805 [Niallia circulans]